MARDLEERPGAVDLVRLPEREAAEKPVRKSRETGEEIAKIEIAGLLSRRPGLDEEPGSVGQQGQEGLEGSHAPVQGQHQVRRDACPLQEEPVIQRQVLAGSPALLQDLVEALAGVRARVRPQAAARMVIEPPGALLTVEVRRYDLGHGPRLLPLAGPAIETVETIIDRLEEALLVLHQRILGRPLRWGLESEAVQPHHGLLRVELAVDHLFLAPVRHSARRSE